MRQKSGKHTATTKQVAKDIRRKTRKRHSAEEKIGIVPERLHGEGTIAEGGVRLSVDRRFVTRRPVLERRLWLTGGSVCAAV
jgi:hypothetical protein